MPFVIENYRMELFTDDSLLDDFCKEYNFKENYILHGQCFDIGIRGRKATFLVENSMGSTCYLRCYIINMFDKDEEYDSIGLQSPSLDEVFRYEYEYIDMVRAGINLAVKPKVVYKVPFGMNDQKYELEFRIGHDNRLGLLEDLDRKGELILPLHTNEIQECYDIKQYQSVLIDAVTTNPDFLLDEGDFNKVTEVAYTLGHRYKENGIQYLYHDDVLKLFCLLLDNAKFRRVFADKYPLILIDEYQDSYKPIIDRFVDYFIAKGIGPQFGFFGDAWQTIYASLRSALSMCRRHIAPTWHLSYS